MGNLAVTFMPAALDACALFRMYIPHLHIEGSRYVHRPGRMVEEDFAGSDVNIVQRLATAGNLQALKAMKECGCKIIYDLDDNVWSLPAYNPAKDLYDKMREGFGVCAAESHVVTVSTVGLKKAVHQALPHLKTEVIVIPNGIDFTLYQTPKTLVKDETVVVGWAGSNTHRGDVAEVWDLLGEVITSCPNSRFELVGSHNAKFLEQRKVGGMMVNIERRADDPNGVPKGLVGSPQFRLRDWVHVAEFANHFSSWGWDIALAPLEDNKFNRSKSCLKILEAAAVNAVCLCSPVQPYYEFCSLDDELKWLMCSFGFQWKEKLRTLINEPERRKYLAERMRKVAEEFFSAKTVAGIWQYAFERAMAHA